MIRSLYTLVFFTLLLPSVYAQSYGPKIADQSHFPAQWVGRWEGTLHINFAGVRPREVPMALEILPIDSANWEWNLIYMVEGQEDRRAYVLQPVQVRSGRWRIDEKNGIILGSRLLGQTLFSLYEVDNQMLVARYSKEGNQIRFEITGGSLAPNKTGGPVSDTPSIEAIPVVNWFEVGVFQQALLTKKENHPVPESKE